MRPIHLAVDYQEPFLAKLSPERQGDLVCGVMDFTLALKKRNIQTLFVLAKDKDNPHRLFSQQPTPREREIQRSLFRNIYFLHPDLTGFCHEAYRKGENDAFACPSSGPLLSDILRDKGYDHVILSGVHTSLCIAETAGGALREGLKCTIAMNLIGDGSVCNHERDRGGSGLFHTCVLDRMLGPFSSLVQKKTSVQILCDFPLPQPLVSQSNSISFPNYQP